MLPLVNVDHTLFIGGPNGILAHGTRAQQTDGHVVCSINPILGFARVLQSEPILAQELGCPLEMERSVNVRFRRVADGQGSFLGLWTEDEEPDWFAIFTDGHWSRREKFDASTGLPSWPGEPSEHASGRVQRYEGGVMVWTESADGTRIIRALASRAREFAD